MPNKINDIVRRSMIHAEKSYGMVIVDAFRAKKIHRECELFFRRQIEGEDMIVINKIELVDEATLQEVKGPGLVAQPERSRHGDLGKRGKGTGRDRGHHRQGGYSVNDDDSKSLAEAGTFGVEIAFKANSMKKDTFVNELSQFLMSIAKDVEARKGGLIGHVKAFARVDDGFIRLNIVDSELRHRYR